jgi:hypothetical protein
MKWRAAEGIEKVQLMCSNINEPSLWSLAAAQAALIRALIRLISWRSIILLQAELSAKISNE